MLLTDMHVWFRQYAQQMGMQNTRAILPEQIDILLNTSINDIVNQIIKENIGITNDRVITDNSKIGQINALRSLYKVKEIEFKPSPYIYNLLFDFDLDVSSSFDIDLSIQLNDNLVETTTSISRGEDTIAESVTKSINALELIKDYVTAKNVNDESVNFIFADAVIGFTLSIFDSTGLVYSINENINTKPFIFNSKNRYSGLIKSNPNYTFPEHLYLVDFSINYVTAKKGYNNNGTEFEYNEDFVTNYYPIRLIDDTYLADTLNDFVLKNRLRSPILTIYNNTYDLYIDKFENQGDAVSPNWTLPGNLLPYTFRMSYIGKPAKVKFNEDLGVPNVECDLPDYLHIDIIKHAVDLYHVAISGNLHSAQQQQQNQQREDVRNNASN